MPDVEPPKPIRLGEVVRLEPYPDALFEESSTRRSARKPNDHEPPPASDPPSGEFGPPCARCSLRPASSDPGSTRSPTFA
jgi:hypothetical protein